MPAEITMPQLSDTMTEGTLVKWLKKVGEKVKSGEVIAEIETDKSTMEMEAYESGTVAHLAVAEGGKVAVGTTIAVLATGKENPAEVRKQFENSGGKAEKPAQAPAAKAAPAQPAATAAPARVTASKPHERAAAGGGSMSSEEGNSVVATFVAASSGEVHEPDEVGHHATRQAPTAVPPIPAQGGNGNGRVRISPLARRIASEHSLDLAKIPGSGPGGRIVQRDVMAFMERPAVPAPAKGVERPAAAERPAAGETIVIPLTKMRATIAARLQLSKRQIPHFYTTVDVDVEAISQLRTRLNQQLEVERVRLSLGDFVAKALAATLLRHPELNATFDGTQITRYGGVNLGIAVALPDGLIVPVLRNIDRMGLKEIRTRSADLVERARAQRLRREELSGATFSVSNLGTYGVREFSAIINPPEVGILAVAAAEKRAVVRGDAVVARTMMSLTLSADHRAVDGATAADFLRTLKQLLEEPALMLV